MPAALALITLAAQAEFTLLPSMTYIKGKD